MEPEWSYSTTDRSGNDKMLSFDGPMTYIGTFTLLLPFSNFTVCYYNLMLWELRNLVVICSNY